MRNCETAGMNEAVEILRAVTLVNMANMANMVTTVNMVNMVRTGRGATLLSRDIYPVGKLPGLKIARLKRAWQWPHRK